MKKEWVCSGLLIFLIIGLFVTLTDASDVRSDKEEYIWREAETYDEIKEGLGVVASEEASGGSSVTGHLYGAYLSYNVPIKQGGNYVVWLRYGQGDGGIDGCRRNFYIDGQLAIDRALFPITGGWNNFVWKKAGQIKLTAGQHRLKIEVKEWGQNIDALLLTTDQSYTPLGKSEDFFKISDSEILKKVDNVKKGLEASGLFLKQAEQGGIDTSYQKVTLETVRLFIDFVIEDIKKGKAERADRMVTYLIQSCQRVENELRGVLNDRSKEIKIPKYQMDSLTIRDGAFYSGDHPVILTGVGYFGAGNMPEGLNRYGFNLIAIETPLWDILSGANEYRTTLPPHMIKDIESAKRQNIAVMTLLSAHYVPTWIYEKYPDIKYQVGCFPFIIAHPQTKELLDSWYSRLIPLFKDVPVLQSYCLHNEPKYMDYSAYTTEAYRRWLQKQYGDVAHLNESWRVSYNTFDGVQPPRDKSNPAMWYDWLVFNQNHVTEYFTWMKERIRDIDSRTPTHIKALGDDPVSGIDHEALQGGVCEIIGTDVGYEAKTMHYDLLRSLAPDKPIFNSEYKIIRPNSTYDYIRTTLWLDSLHGQGACAVWQWSREVAPDGYGEGALLSQPDVFEAISRTALELNRLAKYIIEFPKLKPEVSILYSVSSNIFERDKYNKELQSAYEGLRYMDTPIGFVSEKQIADGKLKGIRFLITSGASHVKDGTYEKIKEYVKDGGRVLVTAGSLSYDEHGKGRDTTGFPGPGREQPGTLSSPYKYGKGEVYHLSTSLSSQDYVSLLDTLIENAGMKRDVRILDGAGKRPWKIEARSVDFEGRKIVYIINISSEEKTVSLRTGKAIKQIRNLINGKTIENDIDLAPQVPLLLEVE